MKNSIITSEGIVTIVTYLEDEFSKHNLSTDVAILYLDILYSNAENEKVVRPFFTFKLVDFDKYIRFFKKYNLIYSIINSNTFSIDDALIGISVRHVFCEKNAISIYSSLSR